jgi:hypothetical protein
MPVLPEGSTLYINQPLTTISTAYGQQGNWIAPQVFPNVPVARQGDLYWKYPQGDWKRTIAGVRAPATESVGGGWEMTTDSYFAKVYAVHKDVDDQTRQNATGGGFNLDADAARWVTEQLLLKRDVLWTQTFMKTGVWTGASGTNGGANGADLVGENSGTTANKFIRFDQSGSDPIGVFTAQILGLARRTGVRPNTLVMGPAVYAALLNNTSIIERVKYSGGGFLTEDVIRQALGVERLVITWTTQNAAPRGAADSIGFLNEKDALLVYAPQTPGLQQLSGGYIFTWDGLLGAGSFGTRIKRFRMEEIASERVEGEMAFDMKVVSPDVGIYFSGAVV